MSQCLDPPAGQAATPFSITLTEQEKAFVQAHPVIRVSNELDWPPFDFIQNGEPAGFAIDYVKMLAQIVGVQLEFVNGYTWSQLLEKGRQKEIDLFPALWKSDDREAFLSFTRPYAQMIKVLVTRKEAILQVNSLADMAGRKIALPTGYTLTEIIMEQFPDFDYVLVKNPAEVVKLVSLGKVDGFVGTLGIINHVIRQQLIDNVQVAAEIELDQDLPLHMAVRKDWAILAGILNKAMQQVDPRQYDLIIQKWIGGKGPTRELTNLTRAENAYLEGKNHITLCVQTDFPPPSNPWIRTADTTAL